MMGIRTNCGCSGYGWSIVNPGVVAMPIVVEPVVAVVEPADPRPPEKV